MNVLKYNPKKKKLIFPYIEVHADKISKKDTDQLNIGLVFETDKNSNADDESIDQDFENIFTKNIM